MKERTAARGFIHPRRARNRVIAVGMGERASERASQRTRSISRATLLYAWADMAGATRPGGLDYDKARGLAHARPSLVHS